MKKTITTGLALLLLINTLAVMNTVKAENNFDTVNQINQYQNGYRYNIQGWVYIHIEGEPYERGYQYGHLASAEITDTLIRWSNLAHSFDFMKIFIIKNRPENYDQLSEQWLDICKTKAMRLFYNKVPEEYKQEMKGMADALKDKDCKIFGRRVC